MKKLTFITLFFLELTLFGQRLQISTIGSQVTPKEVAKIEFGLRFQNNFYRKQFDHISDQVINVKVYGDYSDFYDYASECCALDRFTTAFFIEGQNEIVVFKNQEFLRSLNHEISHALTAGIGLQEYPWLDEGLAEVMSSFRLDSLGNLTTEDLFYTEALNISYRTSRELRRFLSLDREAWEDLTTNESYGLSWAIVNYMYQDDRLLLTKVLDGIQKGITPLETIIAEQKKGLRQFVKGFKRHYRRNKYQVSETRKEL
ncbi:DUF1570 domain-containing protein [Roseivirga misakiensis]|uniref:DUF1570 domain-containing protein n=1 Tax=Roseivirga misakiensis TaxID=1563681 RepID=A0A1E5T0N3_9BACT|nr:DUF1570 domain-containing protein [Roseivirga misakiensis]OEK04934.1 hypothetical protein BFP71_15980 [Roseivirga misakiensis]